MKGQMKYQIKVTPAESREVKRVCDEMGLNGLYGEWHKNDPYFLVDTDDEDYFSTKIIKWWGEYDNKISPQDFIKKYGKQKTSKFKVGDRVRVIDSGEFYTTIPLSFTGLNELAMYKYRRIEGRNLENNVLAEVVDVSNGYVGIESCGKHYIIGEEGLELASEQDDGNYVFSTHNDWYFVTGNKTNKKGLMSYLRDIPKRVKLALNKNLQAMYQLGWINSETFEPTEKGINEMHQMLWDREDVKKEMGERATAEVKRIKEEEKEEK